jgi:hypothetical protein
VDEVMNASPLTVAADERLTDDVRALTCANGCTRSSTNSPSSSGSSPAET